MPKIESKKINCLHRPCSRPAPRSKIELFRTHPEVIEQFHSFSALKLLFLVINWRCWSRKAFPRQMTPQTQEKTAKTAVFRHRWQAWKVVRSIVAVCQRRRTQPNWRCSFAFFESFLWHFNEKQRAEVIFRLSRPVSCKNQENGAGKQWSLHAPLKRYLFHLAPYLKQSTLFPGNFIQIESEPTQNGFFSEINTSLRGIYWINTSLRGILLNEYLFKRYFITASKAMSEELEVLDLQLSSMFFFQKKKSKLRKKER